MDKSTLSNYGWIVIAVLVLAVMIALATPFGSYIENGVRSTVSGLFETSEKAMNMVGMSAGSGNFEDGYQGGTSSEPETLVAGATFSDGFFLTWEELGVYFSVSNTNIDVDAFYGHTGYGYGTMISIVIPRSIIRIDAAPLSDCEQLTSVTYLGTMEEWNLIYVDDSFLVGTMVDTINCSDGTITL